MLGSRIVNAVLDANLTKETSANDKLIFWLYVAVREDLLPMSYYTNMTEAAMVMSATFDFLFEHLDPLSFKVLKNTPSNVF